MSNASNYWSKRKIREARFPTSYEYKSSSPRNAKSIRALAASKDWRII